MDHITHGELSSPWDMEQEMQNYLVKAVVALLREAKPFGSNREQEEEVRRNDHVNKQNSNENPSRFFSGSPEDDAGVGDRRAGENGFSRQNEKPGNCKMFAITINVKSNTFFVKLFANN